MYSKSSWVGKHPKGSTEATICPLPIILDAALRALPVLKYDGLGAYCVPYTASSVLFLSYYMEAVSDITTFMNQCQ